MGRTGMFLFASIRSMHTLSKHQPPLIPHLFTNPLETAGNGLFYMSTLDGKKPLEGGYTPTLQMAGHPLSQGKEQVARPN
jgi:hypothetical protein